MTRRSILPRFLRPQGAPGRPWTPARPRLASLPPTPLIDRDEAQGVSLFELARLAEEAAQ